MAVIVTGMEIPKCCNDCELHSSCICACSVDWQERSEKCPLKSIDGLVEVFKSIAEKTEDRYGYGNCVFSVEEIETEIKKYCGIDE